MSHELVISVPQTSPIPKRAFRFGLVWEIVRGGLLELWSYKLRSCLTLSLLMLGVFALVVMTSVMDGVADKINTGFASMSFDGTIELTAKSPETTEEAKRFQMSPGLRYEDLGRVTAPHPAVHAFLPRAMKPTTLRTPTGSQRFFVIGSVPDYHPIMNRPVASGRGITEDDRRRHATVAVIGSTLAQELYRGSDPVGRDLIVEGVPFRIVGVLAPLQIMSEDLWLDANGVLIPLETYMDRIDTSHALTKVMVKMKTLKDIQEVSSAVLARAKQAHHGIEDVEIADLNEEAAKIQNQIDEIVGNWRVVLFSLAGTVLLVGGVGVLSVMLISYSDRRYEIGLRKALGASDGEIMIQFLLEALVLATIGASLGTFAGAVLCHVLGPQFPYGLIVNPIGLAISWSVCLGLAFIFGLYPALKASRLSPMEAMR